MLLCGTKTLGLTSYRSAFELASPGRFSVCLKIPIKKAKKLHGKKGNSLDCRLFLTQDDMHAIAPDTLASAHPLATMGRSQGTRYVLPHCNTLIQRIIIDKVYI